MEKCGDSGEADKRDEDQAQDKMQAILSTRKI